MRFLLVIILLVGLLLRLYGINFGLPYLYDIDERVYFVDKVIGMLATGDLNPHWFGHPGTTTMYMLCVLYTIIFLGGLGLGIFADVDDFKTLYYQDPAVLYLSGRMLMAIFGVATILLTYIIARRLFNRPTGLLAATFLALSPLHVYFSKFIRTDIQMTFFLLVAFWFCLEIVERQTWSSYVLAGFFTGLATVTKYPALIISLMIMTAHILSIGQRHTTKLFGSVIVGLLGAFIGSPFLFLDAKTVLSDIFVQNRPRHLSATGEGLIQNLVWYVSDPLVDSLSLIGLILSAVGVVICLTSGQKNKWLLISFPVFFLFFIASLNLRWERWIIPMIPFLCILAAHTLHWTTTWIGNRWSSRASLGVGCIVLLGIVVPLFQADILQGRELSGTDTRTLARAWMLEHVPVGSRVLVEAYMPEFPKDWYTFYWITAGGQMELVNTKKVRTAVLRPHADRHIGKLKNVKSIRSEKIEYMILSGWYDRYVSEQNNYTDYAEIVDTYEMLMNMGVKIYEENRVRGKNSGPTIRIYRFNWKD
jgi:4-amino-4-deoxy-L-arabinose transferase-like glycosyltransferase